MSHSGIWQGAAHSAHSSRSRHPGHPVYPGSPPCPVPRAGGSRPSAAGPAAPWLPPGRGQCLPLLPGGCEASPERGHNLTKVTERAGLGTRALRPCGAAARPAPLLPPRPRDPHAGSSPVPNSPPRARTLTPGSESAPAGHRPPLLGVPLRSAPAQRPRALPRRRLRAAPCAGGREGPGGAATIPRSPQTRPRRCRRVRRAPRGRRAAT